MNNCLRLVATCVFCLWLGATNQHQGRQHHYFRQCCSQSLYIFNLSVNVLATAHAHEIVREHMADQFCSHQFWLTQSVATISSWVSFAHLLSQMHAGRAEHCVAKLRAHARLLRMVVRSACGEKMARRVLLGGHLPFTSFDNQCESDSRWTHQTFSSASTFRRRASVVNQCKRATADSSASTAR